MTLRGYLESVEGLSRQQLVLLLARQWLQRHGGTAVVGMACRLPGGVDDPAALWSAVRSGSVLGGRLTGVDDFDAGRFGVDGDELRFTDAHQRVLLRTAADALRDAGIAAPERLQVGVFTAISTMEYVCAGVDGLDPDGTSSVLSGTGGVLGAAAARVALGLRLSGPVLALDTACSSGLSAVHLAAGALRRGECDVAVVASCHLRLSPRSSEVFARADMLSPTGRARPFSAGADGTVRGEGCVALVLKRHEDARADGDRVHALVRGSAVYHHGDRASLGAVSGAGQRITMERALREAEVDPHDVRYVEAHANGVRLAGVIEVEALSEAYRRRTPGAPPLYVGSSKANFGYLEPVSGLVGMVTVASALRHGEIPPQVAADRLDPTFAWQDTSVRVPTDVLPWPPAPARLAAVSAFGITGTYAHAVLEAADPVPTGGPAAAAAATGTGGHDPTGEAS